METANKDIREAIKSAGLKHWMVAKQLGVFDGTFCRWLRTELPAEKKAVIFTAIEQLKH